MLFSFNTNMIYYILDCTIYKQIIYINNIIAIYILSIY